MNRVPLELLMHMPQITCPYCRNTIGLNERREIDQELILGELKSGPKRFTDLYYATHLSRKTLSLRLKALCEARTIAKKEGCYHLNGAYPHRGGKNMFIRNMGRNFSIATKNLRIIALLTLWLIPTAALTYALTTRPAEIRVVLQPPIASFSVSPNPQPNIGWEVQGGKVICGITTMTFDAHASAARPDGHIVEYRWKFGDSGEGTGVTTTHVYSSPGAYVVTLTVIDDSQLTHAASKEVVAYSQPTATVYLSDIPENPQAGSDIIVYIAVADINDLYGWQAGLTFNPNALQCLSFEKGENPPDIDEETTLIYHEGIFEGSPGGTTWIQPTIDNMLGETSPAGCALIGNATPASGSDMLAKVTFKVLSLDSFNLKLTDVMLVDKETNEIPVVVGN